METTLRWSGWTESISSFIIFPRIQRTQLKQWFLSAANGHRDADRGHYVEASESEIV